MDPLVPDEVGAAGESSVAVWVELADEGTGAGPVIVVHELEDVHGRPSLWSERAHARRPGGRLPNRRGLGWRLLGTLSVEGERAQKLEGSVDRRETAEEGERASQVVWRSVAGDRAPFSPCLPCFCDGAPETPFFRRIPPGRRAPRAAVDRPSVQSGPPHSDAAAPSSSTPYRSSRPIQVTAWVPEVLRRAATRC